MGDTLGPSIRFTNDSTDAGAIVLFDCIREVFGARAYVAHQGWDIGVPTYEGEPDGYGGRWGSRTITFTQIIRGSKALALQMQAELARILLRPRGMFLRFQLNESESPVWFPLYQPQPGSLSFENVTRDDTTADSWSIEVTLPAAEFGLQETEWLVGTRASAVTIGNDPTAGGVMLDLPPLRGDAPAPLVVDVVPSIAWDGYRPLMSVAALEDDAVYPGAPIVWPAAGFTAGTDTGAATPSAGWIGPGYRQVSFATSTGLDTRLSGPAPAAPPVGRYQVFARVGRSDNATGFRLRLGQEYGLGGVLWGSTVRHARGATDGAGDSAIAWVPLGDFTFPLSADPTNPRAVGQASVPSIQLQIERTAGTGAARVDALMLVPATIAGSRRTTTRRSLFSGFGIGPDRSGVWDGDRRTFSAYDHGVSLSQGLAPQDEGGFLYAVPGCRNVLHLLHQTYAERPFFGATPNGDRLTATAQVKVSYQPRVLWIGGNA